MRLPSTGVAFFNKGNPSRLISDEHSTNLKATLSTDEKSSSTPNDGDSSNEIMNVSLLSKSIVSSLCIGQFANLQFVNTSSLSLKKQHRVLFVLGGPGAGKGTQSSRIVDTYKCIHLSVGDLLREERKRGDVSEHADLIEKYLVAGQIVPVEISLSLVRNAMDSRCHNTTSYGQPIFLIDGFPRNFDNLSGWSRNMPEYAAVIGSLVYDCPISVLEQRILSRAETSGRSDDNIESARKRFQTFQEQTMPVVHALEEVERMETEENAMSRMSVKHISGVGSVAEVWELTKTAMNKFITNEVLTANAMLLQAIQNKDLDLYSKLCSHVMLHDHEGDDTSSSIDEVFKKYEILTNQDSFHISDANVDIIDGTKVIVTYIRSIKGGNGNLISEFKENRVWSHEEDGWTCIHFVRKPLTTP